MRRPQLAQRAARARARADHAIATSRLKAITCTSGTSGTTQKLQNIWGAGRVGILTSQGQTETGQTSYLREKRQFEVTLTDKRGNTSTISRAYQYDKAGNITQINRDLGETQYGYDGLDRLTQAAPDQNLQSLGLPVEQYGYDPVHNRTSSAHQPGPWSYNADNQLTQYPKVQPFEAGAPAIQTQVTYTLQGHTKTESNSQGEKRYGYNAAERLTTFSDKPAGQASAQIEASYRYDPFGQPRHDGWRSHAGHRGDTRPDGCDAGSRTAPAGIASAFC